MQYKYAKEKSIEDFLLCPICSELFDEPIDHTDCGQTFCKKCIQPLKSCPMCRGNINNTQTTSKVIRGLLNNLKVCFYILYIWKKEKELMILDGRLIFKFFKFFVGIFP
jgi:hypothetical protein